MPAVARSGLAAMPFPTAVRALRSRGPYILTGSPHGRGQLTVEVAGTTVSRAIRAVAADVEVATRPIAAAVMPFRIEAVEHPGWMPVLVAELEVVAEPSGVEVALEGEYRVPGSVAGLVVDLLVLHRVARDSIDALFEGILSRLEAVGSQVDALTGITAVSPKGPSTLTAGGDAGIRCGSMNRARGDGTC